jgi:hypothetical protein
LFEVRGFLPGQEDALELGFVEMDKVEEEVTFRPLDIAQGLRCRSDHRVPAEEVRFEAGQIGAFAPDG